MEAPSAPLGLDPHRVHLVDAYPPGQPVNFLFRGNNPTTTNGSHSTFNLTALVSALALSARTKCSTSLPEGFTLYDLDLENPTDPGYYAEKSYWHAHASLGQLGTPSLPGVWTTLGSVLEPKHTPARDVLVRDGKWALQGHADHLAARLNATRALMLDTNGGPKVLFTHCNAGCDRTGEFIGSYALSYLGYNITTAYGEACKQCGRCPNYYATSALGWWCLTLQQQRGREGGDLGDCLNFAGCKFLGDCDAHGPTPIAHDCPSASAAQ